MRANTRRVNHAVTAQAMPAMNSKTLHHALALLATALLLVSLGLMFGEYDPGYPHEWKLRGLGLFGCFLLVNIGRRVGHRL